MTHKTFKNKHDKEKVYLEAVRSCGGIRVFAYQVYDNLKEQGYLIGLGMVGHYLSTVKGLEQETKGGRYCYTIEGLGQDKLHSLKKSGGSGGVLASPAHEETTK